MTQLEDLVERKDLLDMKTVREFSRPSPARWLAAAFIEWVLIGGVMVACNRWPHWWVWVPGVFLIGTRQHALGILAHESVHYLVARSGFWNDFYGNYLASYALMYPVQGYRHHHLQHHRLLETPRDPERATIDLYPGEWTYPMPRRRFYWLHLRDILMLFPFPIAALLKYIWSCPGGNARHLVSVFLFHAAAAGIAWWTGFGWTYLLLWVLPLFTVAVMCFRLRTAAEHSGIPGHDARYQLEKVDTLKTTRTTKWNPVAKFLFNPFNMAYHVEHHLYPSVPVFRLKRLHGLLLNNPKFARVVHVTSGTQLVRELTRAPEVEASA